MKPCYKFWLVALLPILAFGRLARGQDTNSPGSGGPPDMASMMAMMAEMTKPAENHKILADTVGQWTYSAKYWFSPDTNAAPSTASGKTVVRAVMGGRYFINEHKGTMSVPSAGGKVTEIEFNGMEVAGYDKTKQKFVSSWIDNFGTGIMSFEGDYDPATKAITYLGDDEQMPGVKARVRELVTLTDHDHRKMEYFETQGGREMKFMEITYTRTAKQP